MKKLKDNKKAIELTLQTIVIFIILIIVLVFVIIFFTEHFTSNSDTATNIGEGVIDSARNLN